MIFSDRFISGLATVSEIAEYFKNINKCNINVDELILHIVKTGIVNYIIGLHNLGYNVGNSTLFHVLNYEFNLGGYKDGHSSLIRIEKILQLKLYQTSFSGNNNSFHGTRHKVFNNVQSLCKLYYINFVFKPIYYWYILEDVYCETHVVDMTAYNNKICIYKEHVNEKKTTVLTVPTAPIDIDIDITTNNNTNCHDNIPNAVLIEY